MQIHLLVFQTSIVGRFSYLPLDYYLNTCCSGSSFVLAYLCRRYFWGLIIIFVRCNLNLEQNGPFTLHRQPLGHVLSLKSSLSHDSPNVMWATKKCPQHTLTQQRKNSLIFLTIMGGDPSKKWKFENNNNNKRMTYFKGQV